MSQHTMDSPQVVNNLFFVRKTAPHNNPDEYVFDGHIEVEDSIKLGYRLYVHHSSAPVMLYLHGNGEIASDYDSIVPFYHAAGVSVLVVDYRGYGWSTGTPLTSKLLPDAQVALDNVDTILKSHGVVPERPLFVMGRSLGSAPAVYLAMQNPDTLKGVIIESGYSDAPSLFRRLGIAIPDVAKDDPTLPIGNGDKIKQVTIPLLVIHGEEDMLIPIRHGRELYANAGSAAKTLVTIPNAGHNNVSFVDIQKYFNAITVFVDTHK